MAKRLKDFLTANYSIQLQFSFRENYSTVLALIDVVDDIYSHLEKQ